MIEKILNILSSIRFWELLIGIVLYSLVTKGAITNDIAVSIAEICYTTLGISVGVGTIDRLRK